MSSGNPSTYYAKPNPDEGENVSSFPIGIAGLPTENYYDEYEGIGGEGEMSWLKFGIIAIVIIALIIGLIYLYFWYSKFSKIASIGGAGANIVKNAAGV